MNKQERLQEVYRYLVFSHNVEKQKDLAKALNRNERSGGKDVVTKSPG